MWCGTSKQVSVDSSGRAPAAAQAVQAPWRGTRWQGRIRARRARHAGSQQCNQGGAWPDWRPRLLCSGGVLRQLPGQAGVQRLPVVQLHCPLWVSEPLATILLRWFWCSGLVPHRSRSSRGVGHVE